LRLQLRLDWSRDRPRRIKIQKIRLPRRRRRGLITGSGVRSSCKATRRGSIVARPAKVATAIPLATHHTAGRVPSVGRGMSLKAAEGDDAELENLWETEVGHSVNGKVKLFPVSGGIALGRARGGMGN